MRAAFESVAVLVAAFALMVAAVYVGDELYFRHQARVLHDRACTWQASSATATRVNGVVVVETPPVVTGCAP